MKEWIWNKRRLRPMLFFFDVIVYAIILAMTVECCDMFVCIRAGLDTDWMQEAMKDASQINVFFSEQSDRMFQSMFYVFSGICILSLFLLCGYRMMRIRSDDRELKTFRACGYTEGKLSLAAFADGAVTLACAIPLAVILFVFLQGMISGDEIFARILQQRENRLSDFIGAFFLAVVPLLLALLLVAWFHVRGLRKRNTEGKRGRRLLAVLVFASLLVCILGNSLVDSYAGSLERIANRGESRLFAIEDQDGTLLEEKKEDLQEIEGIGEVSRMVYYMSANVTNMQQEWGDGSILVMMKSEYKALEEYHVAGKTDQLLEHEIILPEYLYGIGSIGEYEYISGSSYIGKELTLKNEDWEETFTVVGTYDNIRTGTNASIFYLCPSEADRLNQKGLDRMDEQNRKEYEELLEQYPQEERESLEETGPELVNRHWIGVYVEEGYDLETVKKQIETMLGKFVLQIAQVNESMVQFYDFSEKLVRMFAGMLTIASLAGIFLVLGTEMKKRVREAAGYMAMGYRRFQITMMFLKEQMPYYIGAFGLAVFISGAVVAGMNYVTWHYMKFYKRYLEFTFSTGAVFGGLAILLAAVLFSLIIILWEMRRVSIVENLRMEG